MTMKKRIVSISLLACMMCLLLAGCQSAKDGGKIANESRNGVARVVTLYEEGTVYFVNAYTGMIDYDLGHYSSSNYFTGSTGTGFGIGATGKETNTFATNRHVVDDTCYLELNWNSVLNEIAYNYGSDTANQYAAYQNQYVPYALMERTSVYILLDDYAIRDGVLDVNRAVECKVTYRGNEYEPDLAVIQTLDGEPVPERVALPLLSAAEDSRVESGNQVYALGYPGSTDDVNTTTAASVDRVTLTDGTISLHTQYIDGNGVVADSLQHTAQVNHGNSGGPLLDDRGAVIAVNTWISGQDVNTGDRMNSYSIEIKYLRSLLDDLRIPYDVYKDSTGLNPVVIVVIIAALIVVAAGVMFVTRKSKSGQAASAQPAQPGQPVQPAQPAQPAQPVRPAQPAQPGQPAQPVRPAQPAQSAQSAPQASVQPQAAQVIAGDSGLRIQGVAGLFASRRFAVSGQLRIGRDPARNDLVYPADSQGVSGAHCVLTVENGRLLLRDLGSTYGTFVGGNRLAANAPVELHVGDRFCLGSERETFVVSRKGEV